MKTLARLSLVSVSLALLHPCRPAAGAAVQGWMTSEGLTGDASAGIHKWDREIVYLSPLAPGGGMIAGMRMLAAEPGWFRLEPPGGFPPGRYALFTINLGNIDGGTVGFDYRPEPVEILEGGKGLEGLSFRTRAHYVAMYNRDYHEWAPEPWLWASNFYQTFVATSDGVTRLATKLAGKDAGPGTHHLHLTLQFALYEATEGPPSSWRRVSPIRERFLPGTMDPIIHVLDVNYLSREAPLRPGRPYAFRLWAKEGSEANRFAVVARPKRGKGYPRGQAYLGDEARDWDLYGYVSGGAPDTVTTFSPLDQDKPMNAEEFLGTHTRHGQTFTATGPGLAAVELLYTVGCNPNPSKPITITVSESVGGKPIGPAKTCFSVTDVCQGRAAAFWAPSEIPLEAGRTYYIEFDSTAGGGINVWSLNGDMPGGGAYVGGRSVGPKDLAMMIVEYRPDERSHDTQPAALDRVPNPISR